MTVHRTEVADSEQRHVDAFLARTIKKRLWAAIAHVNAGADAIRPHVGEHLEYMAKLEEDGRLWASGPFVVPAKLI
jgi:hypothetical protein